MPLSRAGVRIDCVADTTIPDRTVLRFNFFKDNSSSHARTFLSNAEIRDVLSTNGARIPSHMGRMHVLVDARRRTLIWLSYYPFGGKNDSHHNYFLKKGIGQLLEYRVLQHARHLFPQIRTIEHSDVPDAPRIAQLEKRGFGKKYDFDTFLLYLRRKIGEDVRVRRLHVPREHAWVKRSTRVSDSKRSKRFRRIVRASR